MLVKPEWIEVGDIIYFDDDSYYGDRRTPLVVIGIVRDKDGIDYKFNLSDDKEGYYKDSMTFSFDTWWLDGDISVEIILYKPVDKNWIRDKKIDEII
jgi:hypothetical protein